MVLQNHLNAQPWKVCYAKLRIFMALGVKGWEELGWCPKEREGGAGSSADSPEPTELTEVTPPPEMWHFSFARVVTEAPSLQGGKCPWEAVLTPFWATSPSSTTVRPQYNPAAGDVQVQIRQEVPHTPRKWQKLTGMGQWGSRGVSWNWVLKVLVKGSWI